MTEELREARRWTLSRRFAEPWKVEGPDDDRGPIEVIEAQPILDERERLKAALAEAEAELDERERDVNRENRRADQAEAEVERWEKSAALQSKTCHAFDVENRNLRAKGERMLDLLERLVGADVLCLPDDQQSDDEAAATALLRQAGRNQPKEA